MFDTLTEKLAGVFKSLKMIKFMDDSNFCRIFCERNCFFEG